MKRKSAFEVPPSTLAVTHIFDGEEVVTGGPDGQNWIATFRSPDDAFLFIETVKFVTAQTARQKPCDV